jgi:hypothetical protein
VSKYRKQVSEVEPLSKAEYKKRASEAIEKRNESNQKRGLPKTYIPVEEPYNLRNNSFLNQLNSVKL